MAVEGENKKLRMLEKRKRVNNDIKQRKENDLPNRDTHYKGRGRV